MTAVHWVASMAASKVYCLVAWMVDGLVACSERWTVENLVEQKAVQRAV